jgi:hypothetical protein
MTYHVVFDISERYLDALVGVVAIVCLAFVVVLSTRPDLRSLLRRTSWLWLGVAAPLWAVLQVRNLGGPFGLATGALALIALVVAALAFLDREVKLNEYAHAHARSVAPLVAAVMLAILAREGHDQWPALVLQQRLAAGDATVVSGPIRDAFNPNWGSESFSVNGRHYAYEDSPFYVGFHQTAANGGTIRNGLQVRVSSIGDVIVRLEIADGQ